MKKIAFVFGHIASSDGISRCAIAIANLIVANRDYDVTLIPLFKVEKEALSTVDKRVHVKKVFGFYFHGLVRVVNIIPDKFLYKWIVEKGNYNLEIGFAFGLGTQIIGAKDIKTSAKRILWMHTYDYNMVYREQYMRVGHVVNVSRLNAIKLKEELGDNLEISDYCHNPIKDDIIIQEGKVPVELSRGDGLLFVSVGRHSPEKGYLRLITIVRKLVDEGFHFKLLLVGDGPEHEMLKEKVKELNLERTIILTGATSNPHKYTAKADVFVCSSFREGYSTACTEALLLGVPIITTAVGGSQEQIEDAECGIRCGLKDEDLYNALKYVLETPDVIREWREILNHTKIRFTQQARSEKLFDIIDKALK